MAVRGCTEENAMTRFYAARGAAMAGLCLLSSMAAWAQIPVTDGAAIAKQVEQLREMEQQLATLKEQLSQQQQLFGSLNKLTNMGDIAALLNDPKIRSGLGGDFAAVTAALSGNGADGLGDKAAAYSRDNEVYTRGGDDFYAREQRRTQNGNAGQASVAQQMYETAQKRIDGLDQLRAQIGQSEDPKTTMDLQARIATESAYLQNDIVKMQSLRMLQAVAVQSREARAWQDFDRRIDQNTRAFGGVVAGGGGTPSQ
jgi:type IV secretion system protein VirB5